MKATPLRSTVFFAPVGAVLLLLTTPLTNAQTPGSLTNSLVTYYSFSGNFNDQSSNNNHLSAITNVSLGIDRFGNSNSALKFNSTNSQVKSSQSLGIVGNANRSVSFWFNVPNNPVGNISLLGLGVASENRGGSAVLFQNWSNIASTPNFQVLSHQADINTGTLSSNYFNSWHHFSFVYSGQVSLTQLFIDGVLVSSIPSNLANETIDTVDAPVTLGKYDTWNDVLPSLANASIDDVAVYDRALSTNEVTSLYQAQAVPEPSTYALLLLSGAASLFALKRRKR